MFQNYVVLDSSKTCVSYMLCKKQFQNYIILDSNETNTTDNTTKPMFQNYAILNSSKTDFFSSLVFLVILDNKRNIVYGTNKMW